VASGAYDIHALSEKRIRTIKPLQVYFADGEEPIDVEQPPFMIAEGEVIVLHSPRKRAFGQERHTMYEVEGIDRGYVRLLDVVDHGKRVFK
jgi:hypothetical protein